VADGVAGLKKCGAVGGLRPATRPRRGPGAAAQGPGSPPAPVLPPCLEVGGAEEPLPPVRPGADPTLARGGKYGCRGRPGSLPFAARGRCWRWSASPASAKTITAHTSWRMVEPHLRTIRLNGNGQSPSCPSSQMRPPAAPGCDDSTRTRLGRFDHRFRVRAGRRGSHAGPTAIPAASRRGPGRTGPPAPGARRAVYPPENSYLER